MNSGLKERLLTIPFVTGYEPPYLIEKLGKSLIVVKNFQKDYARNDIDRIINEIIFLEFQVENPRRANHHNINTSFVIYTAVLQKETTPTTI